MEPAALSSLQPDQLPALLPGFLSGFFDDPRVAARNRERIAGAVESWDEATCARVLDALRQLGSEHRIYPADPACNAVSRLWSEDAITERAVEGIAHLRDAVAQGPTVLVANHLSFYDSSAVDALLYWSGHADLADRILSAAGPRVYDALFRRFAACCLNTLPVPQSTTFSHTDPLPPRELARQALASLRAARQGAEEGLILLIYAEGSRSRSGHMGPFLKAVRRYLEIAEPLQVVPTALIGTDQLMPVGIERIRPGAAALRFGPRVQVDADHRAAQALEEVHRRISRLLPAHHAPVEGTEPVV